MKILNHSEILNGMINITTRKLFPAFGLLFFSLLSCTNDMEKIKSVSKELKTPEQYLNNTEMIRSDSGVIQMKLMTPRLERYKTPESIEKFPKGIQIEFYDLNLKPKAFLRADWAINYEDRNQMEAKQNVVIVDYRKGDTIYTEHIIWDQSRKVIYSNEFVKRINKDGVLYGKGFEADETFENLVLFQPRSTMYIED
jgi:LPS export ABC transporter protein LptC